VRILQSVTDRENLQGITMTHQRGARPIQSRAVANQLSTHIHRGVELTEYSEVWRNWLQQSESKILSGLDDFKYADYTAGTSQTFDHFLLKHHDRKIVALPGEFQYHQCAGRHIEFSNNITEDSALIISVPFSDTGHVHSEFNALMAKCTELGVPVCLDLAYWGIAQNIYLHLEQFPCVTEVTASLSKPFFTLERHRVGIRFTREYQDDGISMINEVGMSNSYSMSLGIHYMNKFSCDYMWQTYWEQYYETCNQLNLLTTNTVIFGLGGEEYTEYNRGIPGNNRVCISPSLADI
jgi:hypothetical protein